MAETYPLLSRNVSVRIVYQPNVTDCEWGGVTMICMAEQSLDWINLRDSFNVLMTPEPHAQPYLASLLTPTDHPDDEVATKAFSALIVVNFESPNWTNLTDLLGKVAHLAQLKYNYTCTHGENEQVLNDSMEFLTDEKTATDFRTLFLNHTFHLRTRDLSYDETSENIPPPKNAASIDVYSWSSDRTDLPAVSSRIMRSYNKFL
ncbi:hypothetical protein RvY_10708 [Ramazzottius varieornatus]|uniref:Uncharacterized protein n=1 Tax=Ramazzottius varieornatus TaxID=947166 RepID=A0A1D1VDM2_RAMVA|nr:hypothetical protein RvY_10708 [Ramazzottius varieornatus]